METVGGPSRPLLVVGGNLALDLANTVDEPGLGTEFDHLRDSGTVLAWADRTGLATGRTGAELARRVAAEPGRAVADVRRLQRLRRAVQDVFGAVADEDAVPEPAWAQLRRTAGEAMATARLEGDGPRLRPTWDLHDLGALGRPAGYAALELLTHGPLDRVKRCAACPWLYVDQSKNGSRRWCTMDDCGKNAKMRRYVSKRAASRRASYRP